MGRCITLSWGAACLVAGLAGGGPVAEATPGARSPTGTTLPVLALPGEDAYRLAAAAEGRVVGTAGPGLLVAGRSPELALRLWREGAWAVIPAPGWQL
jgi:hypothetical protein